MPLLLASLVASSFGLSADGQLQLTPVVAAETAGVSAQTSVPPMLDQSSAQEGSSVANDTPDIIVSGRSRRGDPAEPLNARSFEAAQAVDRILLGPVASAYGQKSPGPLRDGLRNFLGNLREPTVFINYMLQLKPGKAAETAGRFAINTTAGIAGFFDVARKKPFSLPRRRNSLGNTLGFWGVGPGPFFFLPLVGPTSLRDFGGTLVDHLLLPGIPVGPLRSAAVRIPLRTLNILDRRIESDGALRCLRAAPDPYAATRAFYLARRRDEIAALHGKPGPAAIPRGPRVVPSAAEIAAVVKCPATASEPSHRAMPATTSSSEVLSAERSGTHSPAPPSPR
ncbi:VacJ family lipoprotein [Sphingomonas sp. S-NIH.Pt1_0416]|nr:VacJ family lipoprotein [Sphingomonas sp. S-NIH.Pt1_0416]